MGIWALLKDAMSILNSWLAIKRLRARFDLETQITNEYNKILVEISKLRQSKELSEQVMADQMVTILEARLTTLSNILSLTANETTSINSTRGDPDKYNRVYNAPKQP